MKPNGIGMPAILLLYTSLFPIRQQSNHHSIYQQEHTEELHPEVGEPYAIPMAEDFFKFDYVFLLLAKLGVPPTVAFPWRCSLQAVGGAERDTPAIFLP